MSYLPKRRSIRLPEYDYSQSGYYYVTICTKERELYFNKDEVKQIIRQHWLEIPEHFKNVELDEYIVMPNHIHGIVVIRNCRGEVSSPVNTTPVNTTFNKSTGAETAPLQRGKYALGQIIAYFKYRSTKYINNVFKNQSGQPLWQRNYYEHIIRNEQSLHKIRQYIRNNPFNWERDRNNPKNWK